MSVIQTINMYRFYFILLLLIILDCSANNEVTIYYGGYIRDASTDLAIEYAAVIYDNKVKYTDSNGYFKISETVIQTDNMANTMHVILVEVSKAGYITNYFDLGAGDLNRIYKLQKE